MATPLGTTLTGEHWLLALGEISMRYDTVTGAEDIAIAATVAASDIPHTWLDITPLHCPACLSAHIAIMLISRGGMDTLDAEHFVHTTLREALLAFYSVLPAPADEGADEELVTVSATAE